MAIKSNIKGLFEEESLEKQKNINMGNKLDAEIKKAGEIVSTSKSQTEVLFQKGYREGLRYAKKLLRGTK